MAGYFFATLDPRPEDKVPAAAEANAKTFAQGLVYGIEVTSPALAKRCELGNLDPQHGPGGSIESSAIEAALTAEMPANGSVLATIRPDKDSVGAMAIFKLRANGQGQEIDKSLVEAIGRMDALGPQARNLEVVQQFSNELVASDFVTLGRTQSLDEKIAWMTDLLTGKVTEGVILGFAEEARAELEKAKASLSVAVLPGNRVAIVTGNSPRGFEVGYATGTPVVICFAPSFLRPGASESEQPVQKWTVARYSSAAPIDIAGLKAALNTMEPGWGGPADLVASPQGTTSAIPPEKIIAAVLTALIN